MKLWNILTKKNKEVSELPKEEENQVYSYHNYGLDTLDMGLRSGDYGWNRTPFKKVTLVNVAQCKDRISVFGMASAWRGTGHSEWEYLLAGVFVMIVKEAIETNKDQADISVLFGRELTASGNRVYTRQQVYDHLMDSFNIIHEDSEELKISLKFSKI